MKRILLFSGVLLFLFSCEYQDNGVTSIDDVITSDYLLAGNLDVYISNNQIFRHKGKPGIETIAIGNNNLSGFEDCFVMYVATGTTPETTVSSAIIKLDDMVVLNTSDFSKNAGQHTFEVCNLTPISVLTVEVRGEPGSYLDIWIEGKKKELTVTDVDGNVYKTANIGDQIWMAENLKTVTYNDGTPIYNETDRKLWYQTGASYCWYNNDIANKSLYGALYNFIVVNTGKVCPVGWHVPSLDEWNTLGNTLGGRLVAGGKLKSTGTIEEGNGLWTSPNTGATNEVGFNAIPIGRRMHIGDFEAGVGRSCTFWTSSAGGYSSTGTQIQLYYASEELSSSMIPIRYGMAIRCIKNN